MVRRRWKSRPVVDLKARERRRGVKGEIIPVHHSLAHLTITRDRVLAIAACALLADIAVWFMLDLILQYWRAFFDFWTPLLVREAKGAHFQTTSIFWVDFSMPLPGLSADSPSRLAVGLNFLITALLFLGSLFIPQRFMPLSYFIRACLMIQMSASVFFLFNNHLPYTLPDYLTGQLTLGIYFMFLTPLLLALIYYPLGFSRAHKVFLTVWIIAYFVLALPFQYMLQAYIIHQWTYLFLPLLYLMFGALMDVMTLVAWYSWGMSWARKPVGE